MKILLDQSIWGKIKRKLEEAGFSTISLKDINKTDCLDKELLNIAESQNAVFLTFDFDFRDESKYPLPQDSKLNIIILGTEFHDEEKSYSRLLEMLSEIQLQRELLGIPREFLNR